MPKTDCGFRSASLLTVMGPTLQVNVGFDPEFKPGHGSPKLPEGQLPALVDTGASQSCIDNDLAMQLGLPIVDRKEVSGIHGKSEVNMYLAQVRVPSLAFTIYGTFAGVLLRAGGQQHFALIGRTFLRNFSMYYEGRTGSVTLSNEVPSTRATPPSK